MADRYDIDRDRERWDRDRDRERERERERGRDVWGGRDWGREGNWGEGRQWTREGRDYGREGFWGEGRYQDRERGWNEPRERGDYGREGWNQGRDWGREGRDWGREGRDWGREGWNQGREGRDWGRERGWEGRGREGDWEERGRGEWEGRYRPEWGRGFSSGVRGTRQDLFGTGASGFGTTWGSSGAYGGGLSGSYGGGTGTYGERGRYAGRGPRSWQRADDRIRDDINERLTDHPDIDATEIDVQVRNGEVTLTGTVEDRHVKRMAEDVAESVSGVKEVHNQIRVQQYATSGQQRQPDQSTGTTNKPQGGGTTNR